MDVGLKEEEEEFVQENMDKHRGSQWINLICSILVYFSLLDVSESGIGTLVLLLIAPVMVMGSAWFNISFGAIPAKLIRSSMSITFWMYSVFKVSLSTMTIGIGFLSPPLLWPVLAFIYVGVDICCIQYDTADGLKAGLDEAVLKHSRAALMFYQKEGIDPENEE
jgi:hypothetical protein